MAPLLAVIFDRVSRVAPYVDNVGSILPVMPKSGKQQGIGSLFVLLMLVKRKGVRREGITVAIEIIQRCVVNNTCHAKDTAKHFYTIHH